MHTNPELSLTLTNDHSDKFSFTSSEHRTPTTVNDDDDDDKRTSTLLPTTFNMANMTNMTMRKKTTNPT
jgi:hypothetical protein